MTRRLVLYAVLVAFTGCFERNAAEPRFFRPDSTLLHQSTDEAAQVAGPAQEAGPARSAVTIRLRAVEAGSFLRERIVWRASSIEYGMYEQWRWREAPASYVDRALRSALRRTGAVRFSDDPLMPTVQVEVVAFDEVLAPAHAAVIEVVMSLRDKSGHLLLDGPFSVEAPIVGDDPVTMARAMGSALDGVATSMADAIAKAVTHK